MIAYLVADLVWDSRVRSAAAAAGVQVRRIRSWSDLETLLADPGVTLALIDLEADGAEEVLSHAPELARMGVESVGWGPHVAEDLLVRARQAGIQQVMPRGRFSQCLPRIMGSAGEHGQAG